MWAFQAISQGLLNPGNIMLTLHLLPVLNNTAAVFHLEGCLGVGLRVLTASLVARGSEEPRSKRHLSKHIVPFLGIFSLAKTTGASWNCLDFE